MSVLTEAERLEQEAVKAAEKAAAARDRASRAAAAAEERRQAAWRQYDAELADSYDPSTGEAATRAAEEALRVAVLNDPVHGAAIELFRCRLAAHGAWTSAHGAAARFGRTDETGRWLDGPSEPPRPNPVTSEEFDRIVADEAARLVREEQEAIAARRVELGDRAAANGG